uniref:Uncharacterized protein n=1 Tax=Arundo donax TaxID=35708 RepID=A0A0A9ATK5_ARUDO
MLPPISRSDALPHKIIAGVKHRQL